MAKAGRSGALVPEEPADVVDSLMNPEVFNLVGSACISALELLARTANVRIPVAHTDFEVTAHYNHNFCVRVVVTRKSKKGVFAES